LFKGEDVMSKPNEIDEDNLPQIHLKSWGKEEWFENNEKYCGKLLTINSGYWSSSGNFHYHKIKDETFYIISGELILDVEVDGSIKRLVLMSGTSYRVKPGIKHRFTASNIQHECKFIEVSTTHSDDDSYRCSWNHDNQEWVAV
jgi:mannose-6-phosphate isomerase-like protein (cupin superfamily)